MRVKLRYVGDEQVVNNRRRRPHDEQAIDAAVAEVAEWLDQHLTRLQQDASGTLRAVMPGRFRRAVEPAELEVITTRLASPDRLVDSASYRMVVSHDVGPRWIAVRLTVAHVGGGRVRADLVLVPRRDGPLLVAFEEGA